MSDEHGARLKEAVRDASYRVSPNDAAFDHALDRLLRYTAAQARIAVIDAIDLSALSQSMDEAAHEIASVTRPVSLWRRLYEQNEADKADLTAIEAERG